MDWIIDNFLILVSSGILSASLLRLLSDSVFFIIDI